MPTVVQINTVAQPSSSIGSVMHALHNRLVREGWDSHMVAGYGAGADYVMQSGTAYRVNALRARLGASDVCVAQRATRRMCRHLEDISPDVLHLHNAHGYYLHLPTLLRWTEARGVPMVVTAHDSRLLTGRCALPMNCRLWQQHQCHRCPAPRRYPGCWTRPPVFYAADALRQLRTPVVITSPSAHIASALHAQHIPMGVDKDIFCPGDSEPGSDSVTRCIAVATKWGDAKNGSALNALAAAVPHGLHITVVGRGFVALHPNISVIQHVPDKGGMAHLYRSCHVLLSPSLSESFGLTISEANACGIPAVINAQATPKPWYAPGNAVEAPYTDPHAVWQAIRQARQLSVDPRAVPGLDTMTNMYLQLYQSLNHKS